MASADIEDWNPVLHPRGERGRFSHVLSQAEKDATNRVIDGLRPRKFANDAEAQGYLKGHAPKLPSSQRDAVERYTGDGFLETNRHLRAGDASDPDVARLDAAMRPLPDDLILTRHVGPEAFGLSPASLHGIEGLAGKKITDEAYSSTALGSPYGGGIGGVTIHILTPAGTPAVMASAVSRNEHEREVLLPRKMRYAVARVVRNQRYGYDMYVVALPQEGASDG